MKLRVRDWPSEKDLDHYKCSCSKRLVAGSGFNHGSPTLYTMALGNWNDLDSIRNSCDVYIQGWRICLCKIFLLFSRWAEVTNTLHTKLVDDKTTDLCSLFMAPHNSKAPLSALRIAADALTFYARTWTNLDVRCINSISRSPHILQSCSVLFSTANIFGRCIYKVVQNNVNF